MASLEGSFFGRLFGRTRRVAPTQTVGSPGIAVYAGYPEDAETSRELANPETRYRTYSEILANTSIVAAGVRYFLNLVGASEWTLTPAEADTGGEFAERLEQMIFQDPTTPWHRVVRRAAMYRFYGFSVQEWTMRRHEEGHLTFADIAPRAQRTIERWDVDETGAVLGAIQRVPQTSKYVYLPRPKLMYIVDDSLSDSPEGLGLFRHLVQTARRLGRYTQLEEIGFEMDLRGVPIGYGPFAALAQMVQQGQLTDEDRTRLEKPLREFMSGHRRNTKLSLMLDSAVYTGQGENVTPVNVKQWQVDLLKGTGTSFAENAAAIERLNRELARVLGVDQLLLGSTSTGSYALAESKNHAFYQAVENVLTELREAVNADLVNTAWRLNGWPDEMKPEATTDAVRFQTIGELATVLRDMATAGATLEPDDEAINVMRDLGGLPRIDLEATRERADEDAALRAEEMAALRSGLQGNPDDPDDGLEEPDE